MNCKVFAFLALSRHIHNKNSVMAGYEKYRNEADEWYAKRNRAGLVAVGALTVGLASFFGLDGEIDLGDLFNTSFEASDVTTIAGVVGLIALLRTVQAAVASNSSQERFHAGEKRELKRMMGRGV